MTWYVLLIVVVGVERLVELVVSKRNWAWSQARGGSEFGAGHYPVMVVLHVGLLVGCLVEPLVLHGRCGLDDGPLANLHRQRGDEAIDRPVGIGLPQGLQRRGCEDRRNRLGLWREFPSDRRQLRGLVAEDDELRAGGNLCVARERLASHLGSQAPRALGDRVGAQNRTTPSARERAGHVPAADQTYLHEDRRLPSEDAATRRAWRIKIG